MTGAELAALRRAASLSQTELGRLAGLGRQTVSYWERRPKLDLRAHALRQIAKFLALPAPPQLIRAFLAQESNEPPMRRLNGPLTGQRVRCGAKTRKGTPCAALSLPNKRRCKFHGGMSTGPKTPEGRERIAQAQRARWERAKTMESNGESQNSKHFDNGGRNGG
jgi:transcriptional regulator with XRE-family HTH domain